MRPYATTSDEQFRGRVRAWADRELADFDDDQADDAAAIDLVRRLARGKLLGPIVPREYGGTAVSVRSMPLCIAREELAWSSGLADSMFAMQGLGSYPITLGGTEGLKRRLLPAVVSGRLVTAFAITEETAGSDAAALATTATRDGRGYRLSGDKKFISNAGIAGSYVVFARTDPAAAADGISAFVVEADNPGLTVTERTEMGAPHPIGRLRLDACRVDPSARLGREGDGLKIAFQTLDTFRATVGAAAIGMGRRALDETLSRVATRHQFGKPLSSFQATRMRLADMATRLEGARGLVYRAAWTRDSGERPTLSAAMAKLAATEAAFRVVDDAVQLHGGDGVVRGAIVERLYREVRALRIYEGTSEIQRLVIGRELLAKG